MKDKEKENGDRDRGNDGVGKDIRRLSLRKHDLVSSEQ